MKFVNFLFWSITSNRPSQSNELLGSLTARTTSTTATTSSENITSRFCNNFSIIPIRYACKMYSIQPGIKLISAVWRYQEKIDNLSSCARLVDITAKRVISRRGKDENGSETYKSENCTWKACKTTVFHC